MILTYKLKHNLDIKPLLEKAQKVAEFSIKNRVLSSSAVKHIGLKSTIANQILRKYSKNKNCKKIKSVNLIIPSQSIKPNDNEVYIPCLKLRFIINFPRQFTKISQIEISKDTIYVTGEVSEESIKTTNDFIGVDVNSTGHVAVVACPKTGKVLKLGKKAWHIRKKYLAIRRNLQQKKKYKKIKNIKNRESRIIRDLNHKISKKIIDFALSNNCGIRMENLFGIRKKSKNRKDKKALSYSLNSWSFYQLRQMIDYKSKLQGVKVEYIAPHYTSQIDSKSGLIGIRKGDLFKSPIYGVESSHVNAAFNIALAQNGDSIACRKSCKQRESDTPKGAPVETQPTLEPQML